MLTGVTITGADDNTRHEDLLALAQRYPFVEWGILASRKPPRARYPSLEWTNTLTSLPGRMTLALHVCGSLARDLIDGSNLTCAVWAASRCFNRMQINGYVRSESVRAAAEVLPKVEFILQCRSEADVQSVCLDAGEIRVRGGSASVLFDPSGGRGVEPFSWPRTPVGARLGFAGGIGPDNVVDVLREVGPRVPYWIDMETKVRTDELLDLQKVEQVLEACAPFVRAEIT
ncbi:MAG: hypothetical protein QG602_2272 [Verrucomicrobiota bacterium]|nr:hypothetical protein [Verrucomicrobiota bacterium]